MQSPILTAWSEEHGDHDYSYDWWKFTAEEHEEQFTIEFDGRIGRTWEYEVRNYLMARGTYWERGNPTQVLMQTLLDLRKGEVTFWLPKFVQEFKRNYPGLVIY